MGFVVCCDGAGPTQAEAGETLIECVSDPDSGRQNLRLRPVEVAFDAEVPDLAADLVRIAAYAHFADQMVYRAHPGDVFGDRWRRTFRLHAPLRCPEVWSRPEVSQRLQAALEFATDDRWNFEFSEGIPLGVTLRLPGMPTSQRVEGVDSVITFSGGIDSLVAVLEHVAAGGRPLLASHDAATVFKARRASLVSALKGKGYGWSFPAIGLEISKVGVDERERTQRSRAFLYSAVAAAIAASIGVTDAIVADNGYVSVGLPVNRGTYGAMVSRATHPRFQWLFNRLLEQVLPAVQVRNPLLFKTRREVIERMVELGGRNLLAETISCSAARLLPRDTPQCGTCSQCIDRRVAVAGAGLADADTRYRDDAFLDDLQGSVRILAESYVRLARELSRLSPSEVLFRFSELTSCAAVLGSDELRAVCDMLVRHGKQVQAGFGEVARVHMDAILSGALSPASMLRIAVSADLSPPGPVLEPETIQLTGQQEREYAEWGCVSRLPIRFGGYCDDDESTEVEIDGMSVFLQQADYSLLFLLALRLLSESSSAREREPGWVPFAGEEGSVAAWRGDVSVDHALHRLRKKLQPFLGEVRATRFLQANARRARLATHPAFISVDWDAMMAHPDWSIRNAALEFVGSKPTAPTGR